MPIQLRLELQENRVADEVSAITAVVRPVLQGVLYSLRGEVVKAAGGYDGIRLFMLARARRAGDGDAGICFEYAVHDALRRGDPNVSERVADALRWCKVPGQELSSILFGAEKNGSQSLIQTASEILTDDSVLLYGTQGRPFKLRKNLAKVAAAFARRGSADLPQSVSGLWKADLFTGCRDSDSWIGTTLKINRDDLEGAKGLRVGIVPTKQGARDAIEKDEIKNLVVCPLPYDHSFMQTFYQAWEVVVQFFFADARLPKEANLPRPASRQVARYLEDRREFPVVEVIDALAPLAQPGLLNTKQEEASLVPETVTPIETTTLLAPMPRYG